MQSTEIKLPVSYVRALLRAVEEQGHDAEAFVQFDGVSITELLGAQSIPASLFGRLYKRAIVLLKDETLGMASGGRVPNGTFRMMCLCVIHCETIGDILLRVGEFLDVCRGATLKPSVTVNDRGNAEVGFALVDSNQGRSLDDILTADGPRRVRTSLYIWYNLMSWFAGTALPLSQVTFNFAAPDNNANWQRLFNCPLVFDGVQCALELPAETLALVNVQNESSLSVFLRSAPYRLIVPQHREHTMRDRVLAILGDDFSRSMPDAAAVAEKLNLSVSTLRRQLSVEGTSFQLLKDECRYTAAMRYLGSSELSLNEIARLLGFDDSSAFFRAFRRWSGTTPAAYRRQLD
jgi:AraC-like DNA-binding protein